MKHESEFEKDRKLDIHSLHIEWQNQSDIYGKWAKRAAEATETKFQLEEKLKALRTEVKRDTEQKRAELYLEIKTKWDEYDIFDKPPTETAIASWIVTHEKFKEVSLDSEKKIKKAVDELADAIKNEEYLKGAVLTMSHKKASIEGEVQLWIGGYFSDPKIPKSLKEVQTKETQTKIKKRLKKQQKED